MYLHLAEYLRSLPLCWDNSSERCVNTTCSKLSTTTCSQLRFPRGCKQRIAAG